MNVDQAAREYQWEACRALELVEEDGPACALLSDVERAIEAAFVAGWQAHQRWGEA